MKKEGGEVWEERNAELRGGAAEERGGDGRRRAERCGRRGTQS
jgi:hypothetical protein